MKKSAYIVVSLLAIALVSCYKPNGAGSGGMWSFKSKTYSASFTSYIAGALTASTENSTPSGSLAFYFYDSISNATIDSLEAIYSRTHNGADTVISRLPFTFPPKLGTYIMSNSIYPDSGYVYVQLTDTSIANSYVITGSTRPTVTVTKAANGFITVVMPPVEMWNINNSQGAPLYFPTIVGYPTHTDSSLVSGKITQTQ